MRRPLQPRRLQVARDRWARRALAGLALVWGLTLVLASPAAAGPSAGPRLEARSWSLIDARDGKRLAGHVSGRELPIASTTKLMTAYIALERLPLQRKIAAPAYRAGAAESVLGLQRGEKMTVRDLLYALVLRSANDAAVTLADGVAGSERHFVARMNRTAAALGLTRTHYTTPVGLDQPGNHSTADDLVALARLLLRNQVFARAADSRKAILRSGRQRRRIVTRNTLALSEPWVTGVKTGHTLDAGYVLVGSGRRKGISLISAVLGAPSEAARDAETRQLLEYGFSLYRRHVAVAEGRAFASAAIRYRDERLPLVAAAPLRVTLRDGERVTTRVEAPRQVDGPIAAGRQLGRVFASVDGRPAGDVALVAARSVGAASLLRKLSSAGVLLVVPLLVGLFVIVVGLRRRPRRRSVDVEESERAPVPEDIARMREERRKMREERRRTGKEESR
ncbi:MAG: hypothetical protein QOG26_734 [Solirubrobacterales bacterium]|nr:hypothetical protein [Solirubrobacterales bacterium]